MESYYRYLIISTTSIAVLYLAYYYFFRKMNDFKKIRIFLLSAMIFSLLLPFSPASINLSDYLTFNTSEQLAFSKENKSNLDDDNIISDITVSSADDSKSNNSIRTSSLNYIHVITSTHFLIAGLLILRLLLSILKMLMIYSKADKKQNKNYTLILLDKRIIAFSFFKWIFIDKTLGSQVFNQIIEHEKAHADQYHTFDLLFSELLVAAMWFNPFVWLFKKALTQVHEYLADEQVLDSGCNKLEYQCLLVNQAAEERLVAVSSNFSYSLLKKRIMMMQKTKIHGRTRMKFIALAAITAVLIFSAACFNQPIEASAKNSTDLSSPFDTIPKTDNANNELVAAISPTKMNVLYIGLDNPVSIAVTGAQKDKIKVSIENGDIKGKNGKYIVRVKNLGKATILVEVDNKIVSKQEFRVKMVPDPMAMVAGKTGGKITKKELLNAGALRIVLVNFDFDLHFGIAGYSISTVFKNGYAEDVRNIYLGFSKQSIKLIEKSEPGQHINFEDIQIVGPDGNKRMISSLIFEIVD